MGVDWIKIVRAAFNAVSVLIVVSLVLYAWLGPDFPEARTWLHRAFMTLSVIFTFALLVLIFNIREECNGTLRAKNADSNGADVSPMAALPETVSISPESARRARRLRIALASAAALVLAVVVADAFQEHYGRKAYIPVEDAMLLSSASLAILIACSLWWCLEKVSLLRIVLLGGIFFFICTFYVGFALESLGLSRFSDELVWAAAALWSVVFYRIYRKL